MQRRYVESLFLSTLSLRRATERGQENNRQEAKISIHALLAESDPIFQLLQGVYHPFLSTLSLRRATMRSTESGPTWKFLSTLSLRRATFFALYDQTGMVISIHALLAESDRSPLRSSSLQSRFLSTLSLRRATGGPRFSG